MKRKSGRHSNKAKENDSVVSEADSVASEANGNKNSDPEESVSEENVPSKKRRSKGRKSVSFSPDKGDKSVQDEEDEQGQQYEVRYNACIRSVSYHLCLG